MPAITNIVINDGESTPVAHTFAPVTTNGSIAKLASRTGSIPQNWEQMTVDVKQASSAEGAHQVRIGVGDPVEATVNGTVVQDHLSSFEIKFNLSQKSTLQERKNLLKLAYNALANATIVTVVENIEPIY